MTKFLITSLPLAVAFKSRVALQSLTTQGKDLYASSNNACLKANQYKGAGKPVYMKKSSLRKLGSLVTDFDNLSDGEFVAMRMEQNAIDLINNMIKNNWNQASAEEGADKQPKDSKINGDLINVCDVEQTVGYEPMPRQCNWGDQTSGLVNEKQPDGWNAEKGSFGGLDGLSGWRFFTKVAGADNVVQCKNLLLDSVKSAGVFVEGSCYVATEALNKKVMNHFCNAAGNQVADWNLVCTDKSQGCKSGVALI